MTDIEDSRSGFKLTGGTMEVHALGGEAESNLVDRPDVAAVGLEVFDQAFEAAGGVIEGDVHLRTPGGGLRLVRSGEPHDSHGGGAGGGGGG